MERGPTRVLASVLVLRAQCKVTGHALIPLNLQTGVWAPPAATKDDGDEMGGGGMAAALSTRADPELLLSSPGMGLCAFSSISHPAGVQAASFPSRGAEPPVTARGSC